MEVSELSALRQVPYPGPFSLDDLKLEGGIHDDSEVEFAVIDWSRVKDLVRGEEILGDATFTIMARGGDSKVAAEEARDRCWLGWGR